MSRVIKVTDEWYQNRCCKYPLASLSGAPLLWFKILNALSPTSRGWLSLETVGLSGLGLNLVFPELDARPILYNLFTADIGQMAIFIQIMPRLLYIVPHFI